MNEQIMTAELRTVRVADITEFPTELGNRCYLLREIGLDPYQHTEEELMAALMESAEHPDSLDVCGKSSRCGAFLRYFKQGLTPFQERDPIRLMEYGGRYHAGEGKHRVCMAKRIGVETMEAYVWELETDDFTLLTQEGMPTHFRFSCTYPKRNPAKAKGEAAALWVHSPPGSPPSRFDFGPALLDLSADTQNQWRTVLPGLKLKISAVMNTQGFRRTVSLSAEVKIADNHAKTKIWLIKGPAKELFARRPLSGVYDTVYRYGCWRNRHMKRLNRDSLAD